MRVLAPISLIALVLPALLAGCTNSLPVDPDFAPPAGETATGVCPRFPDNSSVECDAGAFAGALTASTAPALTDGWVCRGMYDKKGRMSAIVVKNDGATGIHFDWREQIGDIDLLEGGAAVTTVVANSASRGQTASALFDVNDARGFLALPEPIAATDENVLHYMRVFYLMEKRGDDWIVLDDAELVVGDYEGTPWYTWRWTPPGAETPLFLDLMEAPPADDDGPSPTHRPVTNRDVSVGNYTLNVSTWSIGVLFKAQGTARSPDADCSGVPPVPVD